MKTNNWTSERSEGNDKIRDRVDFDYSWQLRSIILCGTELAKIEIQGQVPTEPLFKMFSQLMNTYL